MVQTCDLRDRRCRLVNIDAIVKIFDGVSSCLVAAGREKKKRKKKKKKKRTRAAVCEDSVVIIFCSATDGIGSRTEVSQTPSFWELKE